MRICPFSSAVRYLFLSVCTIQVDDYQIINISLYITYIINSLTELHVKYLKIRRIHDATCLTFLKDQVHLKNKTDNYVICKKELCAKQNTVFEHFHAWTAIDFPKPCTSKYSLRIKTRFYCPEYHVPFPQITI